MKHIFLCLVCLLFAVNANAQGVPPQTKEVTKLQKHEPHVEIWLPPEFQSSENKWPLIVFSHGFGGCPTQSKFLTSFLADQGYIVIAPEHADANCRWSAQGELGGRLQEMRSGKSVRPEEPFRTPEIWTEKTESDRRDDVLFALSSMLDDRQYKNYVDTDRLGLMGHSLGGYTVMGIAGGWKGWTDTRFKAVLAMAPYIEPYLKQRGLRRMSIPVLYQVGTRDKDITSSLMGRGKGYGQTAAPKYLLELDGAAHFAWTDSMTDHHLIIQGSALAFFDKYLKGKDVTLDYKPGKHQVKTFWKDEEVTQK